MNLGDFHGCGASFADLKEVDPSAYGIAPHPLSIVGLQQFGRRDRLSGMTDNRDLLKLIPEQREDLQRWAQSRTLPAEMYFAHDSSWL